jgi:chloramphenicol-sensitive protein RarD
LNRGVIQAAVAYFLWGAFPVYFKALQNIPPLEILLHRIVWSLAFVALVLAVRRQWRWILPALKQPRVVAGFTASALLLSSNWLMYIWAVNHGRVIDASLGYFINPLVNILLGYVFLHERLRRTQWAAIALAAAGVAWLTWQAGHPPWIGLTLALTFGSYGLLRKTAALGALEGLVLETALLFPLAAGGLALLAASGQHAVADASWAERLLVLASGPITAIPLLLFAAGARTIPLSTLGLLQYIGPTLQLAIGVWLYHEPFHGARIAGFAAIWIALALYSLEGLIVARRAPAKR